MYQTVRQGAATILAAGASADVVLDALLAMIGPTPETWAVAITTDAVRDEVAGSPPPAEARPEWLCPQVVAMVANAERIGREVVGLG